VFGAPWTLPFEFPLYQAAAAMLIDLGAPVEVALRGLSLAAFLLSGGLLWAILARHAGRTTALLGTTAFLFSPYALLWSRTSMIEYPAVAGALAFMLGTLEWHRRNDRRWLALALLGGSLAALIKITTAVYWVAPALLVRRRATLLLVAIPAALGLVWTRYADSVKAASEATAVFTSSALFWWNFGGDRLSVDTWRAVLWPVVIAAGMLLLPIGLLVIRRPERLLWAWFAIALVGPPLTFTSLYADHDYYAVAVTPAIAAFVGGGIDELWRRWPRLWPSAVVLVLVSFVSTAGYWQLAYEPVDREGVQRAARRIEAAPKPVAVRCADWSPAGFFYAHESGYIAWRGEPIPAGFKLLADKLACPHPY